VVFEHTDGERTRTGHTDVATEEGVQKFSAGIGLCAGRDQSLFPHLTVEIQRLAYHWIVRDGRFQAILTQYVTAAGPDQWQISKGITTCTTSSEVEPVGIIAKRRDGLGGLIDFLPGGGRLFRVEACLLEQALVVQQHRTFCG